MHGGTWVPDTAEGPLDGPGERAAEGSAPPPGQAHVTNPATAAPATMATTTLPRRVSLFRVRDGLTGRW